MKKKVIKEQRSYEDRRHNNSLLYKFIVLKGKRRTVRRIEDRKRIVDLDYYHPTLLISILIVLCLSLLDAALTLILLDNGAIELNPVMRYYINLGPVTFVMVKYGITALALMIMVGLNAIISYRYRIAAIFMFPSCILVFGSVIMWELYLLTRQNIVK